MKEPATKWVGIAWCEGKILDIWRLIKHLIYGNIELIRETIMLIPSAMVKKKKCVFQSLLYALNMNNKVLIILWLFSFI